MKNHPSFITLVNKTVMGHAHRQFAERGVQNPQKHKDLSPIQTEQNQTGLPVELSVITVVNFTFSSSTDESPTYMLKCVKYFA